MNTCNPLISIIVPIYNVEQYLCRCVDSLINQTYKDLEIILVDDGSPDRCGEICDEYAKRDDRIIVIHKRNGGLSEARNSGKEKSKGEYLMFIDSDDWIELDTCEVVVEIAMTHDADMVPFGVRDVYSNGDSKDWLPFKSGLMGKEECMSALIYNMHKYGIFNYACNKLYSRRLLENVEFLVGRVSEDHAFVYKLVHKANSIVVCNKVFYNYYRRKGSISNHLFYPKLIIDRNKAWMERLEFIRKFYPHLENMQLAQIIGDIYISLIKLGNEDKYKDFRNEIISFADKYRDRSSELEKYSKRIKLHNRCYPLFWIYVRLFVK